MPVGCIVGQGHVVGACVFVLRFTILWMAAARLHNVLSRMRL